MTDSTQPRAQAPRWSPALVTQLREATQPQAAAAVLAAAGVPVFPCVALQKRPLTLHGFHDASVNPDQVSDWWSRWPEANVAMPTGVASGIDVVDVDVHDEGDGFAAIRSARASGLLGDPAWMVRTPSAGLHLCFLHAADVSQPSWQAPSRHVDFRGDGGYVVLPPSEVTQGDGTVGRYEVIEIASRQPDSVDAGALRRFLEPPRPARAPADRPVAGARPDRLAAWVASLTEGERNHGLFWASCRMAEAGERFDVATHVLGEAALKAGLSDREASSTIQSAYRIATSLGAAGSRCPRPPQAAEGVRL